MGEARIVCTLYDSPYNTVFAPGIQKLLPVSSSSFDALTEFNFQLLRHALLKCGYECWCVYETQEKSLVGVCMQTGKNCIHNILPFQRRECSVLRTRRNKKASLRGKAKSMISTRYEISLALKLFHLILLEGERRENKSLPAFFS